MTGLELAIAKRATPLLEKGIAFLPRVLKSINDRIKYEFREAHLQYCSNAIGKYCRARTFFIRNEPQFLKEFYVPASILKKKHQRIEKADLTTLSDVSKKCIVTGSGGSGKTIFMRHLLLDAIERNIGYPVFIELRNLNESNDNSLEKLICDSMKSLGFNLGDKYVLRSLKDGLLVVLLDGFDEVVLSKRRALELEIRNLATSTDSQIVISSRPDIVLEGWDDFSTVQIAPLALQEACELIDKIRFDDDDEIKEHFISKLRDGLFESHRYFLSNPLLLSIMLLTYGDSADIPRKLSSFFEQAYTALFQKHDALKSGFRRQRRTNLDIYEFSRLFAAFSAITYNKRLFRFSLSEAIKSVKQGIAVSRSPDVSPSGFIDDAKQAVCLLIDDGLDLAYVHRSFQEYFVAKFINDAESSVQNKYIENISRPNDAFILQQDNVLALLYEINPAVVEDNYLIPNLEKVFGAYAKRKLSLPAWRSIFGKTIKSLHRFSADDHRFGFSIKDLNAFAVIAFVHTNCISGGSSEPKRRLRSRDRAEAKGWQDELFAGRSEVRVSDIPDRSGFWRRIAGVGSGLSWRALEAVRLEYVEMLKRSLKRAEAVTDVFDFSDKRGRRR